MPIRNTIEWKMYIEKAFERQWPLAMLVQTYEKEQVQAVVDNEEHDEDECEEGRENEEQGGEARENEEEREEGEQIEETNVLENTAQGTADEGERIPRIVEQMENEDDEVAQTEHYVDSSDDEDQLVQPVPAEWR